MKIAFLERLAQASVWPDISLDMQIFFNSPTNIGFKMSSPISGQYNQATFISPLYNNIEKAPTTVVNNIKPAPPAKTTPSYFSDADLKNLRLGISSLTNYGMNIAPVMDDGENLLFISGSLKDNGENSAKQIPEKFDLRTLQKNQALVGTLVQSSQTASTYEIRKNEEGMLQMVVTTYHDNKIKLNNDPAVLLSSLESTRQEKNIVSKETYILITQAVK